MKTPVLKFTISGAMVAAAMFWGGQIEAKVEKAEGIYKVLNNINTRLSRIEGALGVKSVKSEEKAERNE